MTDGKKDGAVELGVFGEARARGIAPADVVALALSAIWLIACILFFTLLAPEGDSTASLRFVSTLLVIFMPIAVIWLGAATTRSARIMREESARLQAAIDALRHTYLTQSQNRGAERDSAVERKLDELTKAQKQTEVALATFTSIRPQASHVLPAPAAPRPSPADQVIEDQGSLALGPATEDMAPPLPISDFIRAMHFPENAEDKEGFRALRRALRDRKVSGLVQAAQDVLTLLSQDGIYMDDLSPDRARPEIWRAFAKGERGRSVAALGGIRDRSSLALTAGRMRQDTIFRDAAHHFLRRFDQVFSEFAEHATDEEIARMAETRTARAFMLLGRVTGTFD